MNKPKYLYRFYDSGTSTFDGCFAYPFFGQLAYATKREAYQSFIYRKKRQIPIIGSKLNVLKKMVSIAVDHLNNENFDSVYYIELEDDKFSP